METFLAKRPRTSGRFGAEETMLLPGQFSYGPQGSVPVFASRTGGALHSTTETQDLLEVHG
jgi:hypothetical protein